MRKLKWSTKTLQCIDHWPNLWWTLFSESESTIFTRMSLTLHNWWWWWYTLYKAVCKTRYHANAAGTVMFVLFVCLFLLYTGSIFRGKFKYPSVLPYGPVNVICLCCIYVWGSRGYSEIWFGQGCAARASNPYPSLRVILAEKGTHY